MHISSCGRLSLGHDDKNKLLRWRHNGHDGVSNHQPHDCLLNRLFGRRSKKRSKHRVASLCAGNSPGTGEFPTQMASNAETVSIWWRHLAFHRNIDWLSNQSTSTKVYFWHVRIRCPFPFFNHRTMCSAKCNKGIRHMGENILTLKAVVLWQYNSASCVTGWLLYIPYGIFMTDLNHLASLDKGVIQYTTISETPYYTQLCKKPI